MIRMLVALFALMLALPAAAQDVAQGLAASADGVRATSPDGRLAVTVTVDGDGRPLYRIDRDGKPLVADSRLGFLLADQRQLSRGFAIAGHSESSSDSRWEQPWGEWKTIRDNHRELRVDFHEKAAPGRAIAVVFRLFDDGFGFRYEFPDQPGLKRIEIADELTEFNLAQDGEAWWIPAGEWNRYEYLYHRTPVSAVGQAHTPVTMKLADGTYVALHEAALVDYASMWLKRVSGTGFRATLAPTQGGPRVAVTAPFATPWRTMRVADDVAGLYAAQVELNLNEPNKLGDVSWFKPSKYVGIWWEMHLNRATWSTGPRHGATTGNTKRYIDFAAKHGFRGVLVEGWNTGWDGDWFGNGGDFDFAKATPDFDIDALAAYAAKKGVHLIGHHETGGDAGNYDAQLDRAYAYAADHGEEVVKTGYVADAGGIQRSGPGGKPIRDWHDGQYMVNHHLRVVLAAAKHRVAVNAHEPVKDTGLRRTYPNWISREGARGMEYNAWGTPKNPPEHEVNLIFTRMLAGPMDYTPGVLSLEGSNGTAIPSTVARQLALYVVLYSPVQMAADLPENYEKHRDALRFIEDVPVDWEDTRVLNGAIGDYVTIARKDRSGPDWYLGAITDEDGRSLSVPLDFLDPAARYEAQIYRDGAGADFRTEKRFAIAIEKRVVTGKDRLTIELAPGGGTAVRFKRLGR